MFTHTGLQDKRSNHLSQFVGLFLRPEKFLEDDESQTPSITNGHWFLYFENTDINIISEIQKKSHSEYNMK